MKISLKNALLICCGVAAGAYLFDPRMGRTRRAELAGRLGGLVRRKSRDLERRGRYVGAQAAGLRAKAANVGSETMPESDAVLHDKIMSEVLGGAGFPKSKITVECCDGVATLRGEVDRADQMDSLVNAVARVTGVVDVHNFLHMPGSPAPNKLDAIRASH